jgi:hypothetical protein
MLHQYPKIQQIGSLKPLGSLGMTQWQLQTPTRLNRETLGKKVDPTQQMTIPLKIGL